MTWEKRAAENERRVWRAVFGLTVLVVVTFVAMCELAKAHPAETDRPLIERAASCGVDPFLATELLHVEDLAGVPKRHRGMLLAKACFESRGNARAVGDGGKAIGLLQLWPWAERTTDRRDPVGSAYAYLGALFSAVKRAKRHCPESRRLFRLAWIRVNRGPFWRRPDRKGERRCSGADPAGMRVLRKWRRGSRT